MGGSAASPTLRPRLPRWFVEMLVWCALGVVTAVSQRAPEFRSPAVWVPALLVCGGALMLRRRWPALAFGVCLAVVVAFAAVRVLPPTPMVASAIAVYAVARWRGRLTAIVATVVAAVVLGVSLVVGLGGTLLDAPILLVVILMVAAAAGGDAARSRAEYIAEVTERAVRAEETREAEARRRVAEERLRIARDLHDVVAHQMTIINLQSRVASRFVRADPERAEAALDAVGASARTVLSEISGLLTVLRAGEPGAESSAPLGLGRLDALVADFAGVGFEVERIDAGEPVELPPAVDVVAYRIIQESLTNARRHGDGPRAVLELAYGSAALRITVTNPMSQSSTASSATVQSSAVPSPAASSGGGGLAGVGGFGLMGVRERVEAVHGALSIQRSEESGFRLEAVLPYEPSAVRTER